MPATPTNRPAQTLSRHPLGASLTCKISSPRLPPNPQPPREVPAVGNDHGSATPDTRSSAQGTSSATKPCARSRFPRIRGAAGGFARRSRSVSRRIAGFSLVDATGRKSLKEEGTAVLRSELSTPIRSRSARSSVRHRARRGRGAGRRRGARYRRGGRTLMKTRAAVLQPIGSPRPTPPAGRWWSRSSTSTRPAPARCWCACAPPGCAIRTSR